MKHRQTRRDRERDGNIKRYEHRQKDKKKSQRQKKRKSLCLLLSDLAWPKRNTLSCLLIYFRRKEERYLDHENFAIAVETVLTSHFMYGNESDLLMKCVPTSRMAVMVGDAIPEDNR